MLFSEIERQILTYLGFRGIEASDDTRALMRECLESVERAARFRYLHAFYTAPLPFLEQPPYRGYLSGSTGYFLCVATLGRETDALIRRLSVTDLARAVVADACASAYLEYLADAHERTLGDDLSFRFCPGYGGSDSADVRQIFAALRPERAGVCLTESGLMVPQKSVAGIVAKGKRADRECGACMLLPHCAYRKEGTRCYNDAK